MSMTITPVSVTANQTVTLTCPFVYMNSLNVNATSRNKVTAQASATPYALDNNQPIYSLQNLQMQTTDLFAAAAVIPEMATALEAVQLAIVAWWNYTQTAQANLSPAIETLNSTNIALQNSRTALIIAQNDLRTANAALSAAFAGSDADAITTARNAAGMAQSAAALAQIDFATAQTAVNASQASMTALQQLLDPANANRSMKKK